MNNTDHVIVLGAPRDIQPGGAPLILQRSDEDFVEAVLDEFKSANGRTKLRDFTARTRDANNILKLFQPIQRQHHLALIEAWCDTPGEPRLDPAKIESAGLVVRRVAISGGRRTYQGWMRSKGKLRGWLPVERIGGAAHDPASTKRLEQNKTGVADIDKQIRGIALQQDDALLDEHVVPMFVAPPDVCAEAGKTMLYGLIPTVSSELAQAPVVLDEDGSFGPETSAFKNHLVEALRGEQMDFPLDGETLDPDWYEAVEMASTDKPAGVSTAHWDVLKAGSGRVGMQRLIRLLRQLAIEFNVFEGVGTDFATVRAELAKIDLPLKLRENETVTRYVKADVFLRQASAVLLEHDLSAARPEMPTYWPALSNDAAIRLRQALSSTLAKRFAELNGAPGRFDEPGAQYVVRTFVRFKPECGCPHIRWSADSAPFVIAPWYEGSGAPPVKIPLPDVTDRALLKSLKPNVSFVVPPALQNLLGGSPKDMLEGKGSTGGNMTLGWICSFSIPTITICAFIVLNIFFSLLDLIFSWMFFIKICIPYPKKG